LSRHGRNAVFGIVIVITIVAFSLAPAYAGSFNAFGPQDYKRSKGKPIEVDTTFSVLNPSTTYTLEVTASSIDEDSDGDSDKDDPHALARITLNGEVVLRLHQKDPRHVSVPVHLLANNQIGVKVLGKPGGTITVAIVGVDNDLPVITAVASPPANAAGWNNSDVTVTFSCSDATSGIAVCPSAVLVTTEGNAQTVQGTAIDKAGNQKSATIHVSIDKTPPTITATVTPAPVNGVVTQPASGVATVSFTCTDALSGIAGCPALIPVTTVGPNQTFSGTATDKAGNSAPTSITFSVQAASPLAISASVSSQPNANGWYNSNVTISYQCSGGVQPLQCPSQETIPTEGFDQQIVGTVTDAAGQKASVTTHLNIDKTPPTITASVAPAPINGVVPIPANGIVTVSFVCSDALSGIATCPASISVTTAGLNESFSGTAVDRAGNSATANTPSFSVQLAPLTISATFSSQFSPSNQWYRSDVTISYQCSGGVPPLQCPPSQTISTEGTNHLTATVTDAVAQRATTDVDVDIDRTAPNISASVFPPPNANGWNNSPADVLYDCNDSLSGIDTCPPAQTLSTEGAKQVATGLATDLAGNSATTTVTVNMEVTGPTITASATPAPNSAGWNNTDVNVTFTCGTSVSGGVQCPASQVVNQAGTEQVVRGTVTDLAGISNTAFAVLKIDKTPPVVTVTSLASGAIVSSSRLSLSGSVSDNLSGVAEVNCSGVAAIVTGNSFTCDLSLTPGLNSLSLQATDVAGNVSSVPFQVNVVNGPKVTITSPTSLQLFGANPITITGNIDDPQATVTANGVNGTVSGNTFTISGITLHETKNLLTVTATNAAGGTSTATVTVFLDTTPPQVHIDSPVDGAVVNTSQLTVMGNVNDLVSGTVNGNQVSVSVNGVNATVSNRSFAAQNILLAPGQNTITAIAKDQAGNTSRHQTQVTFRDATAAQHLVIVSGDNQSGVINTVLPQPLVVQAVDGLGRPIANRVLTLQVSRSDGTMAVAVQSGRNLTVVTDGNGQASVKLQLGSRSGVGINQVAVTAPGFVGDTVFYATSTVAAPVLIRTVSGEVQKGAIGSPLPEPLVVIVMDAGGNPVANVPVTFQVNAGNGTIDAGNSAVKTTDLDGKAFAVLTIGQQPGSNNNTVSATFPGNTGLPAQFVASGVITGPAAATTISGIVLDNASQPIPDARASIKGSQVFALTNPQGQFTIPGAPVGDVMLYVDGTSSKRPERFPTLSFQMTTLPGIDNALPGPIYLPPIDSDNTQMIDNTSDQDVVLTVKGMPGVQYTVFAHSATFADGSKSGSLSLSQVHVDRVPMTPANGTAPSFVTTLQPPGVSFDPPVRMQVPNTSGLLPGQVAEVFSYRHDLEQFVSEGTGRVSDDGSVITTDPGFGLHVSGWNLIPPPPVAPNTTCNCSASPTSATSLVPIATLASVSQRSALSAPLPALPMPCFASDCDVTIKATADGHDKDAFQLITQEVKFHAEVLSGDCSNPVWNWNFGDKSTDTGPDVRHAYDRSHAGLNAATVTLTCSNSTHCSPSKTINVTAFKMDLSADGATQISGKGNPDITHFVTPRGSGMITIHAKPSPDSPDAEQVAINEISWDGATQDATDKLKATVSATSAAKNVVRVTANGNLLQALGGVTIQEGRAWVVWATITGSVDRADITPLTKTLSIGPNGTVVRIGTAMRTPFRSQATISPIEIITDSDRPDLEGPNTVAPPGGLDMCKNDLSSGAKAKWDIAQRVATVVTSTATDPAFVPGKNIDCLAQNESFPLDPVVANDDFGDSPGPGPEIDNPYDPATLGQLLLHDRPLAQLTLLGGQVGDTLVADHFFQVFVRLQLGNTWAVISDPFPWRVEWRFKKKQVTEALWNLDLNDDGDLKDDVTEEMIDVDTNGNGTKTDPVGYWADDGWISALDNKGAP